MRKLRPRETWGSHVATINSNFEELNAAAGTERRTGGGSGHSR